MNSCIKNCTWLAVLINPQYSSTAVAQMCVSVSELVMWCSHLSECEMKLRRSSVSVKQQKSLSILMFRTSSSPRSKQTWHLFSWRSPAHLMTRHARSAAEAPPTRVFSSLFELLFLASVKVWMYLWPIFVLKWLQVCFQCPFTCIDKDTFRMTLEPLQSASVIDGNWKLLQKNLFPEKCPLHSSLESQKPAFTLHCVLGGVMITPSRLLCWICVVYLYYNKPTCV